MDKIKWQSIELYRKCFSEDQSSITNDLENRQRMVAELNRLQNRIAINLNLLTPEISECWRQDIEYFVKLITRVDQEMADVLEFQKERTLREIVDLRQEKENVKRFNLSSLR